MKPAYEIVAAAELRVGDVVTIEPDLDPWIMDDVRLTESYLFYRGAGQATEFSMPRDRNIFRQLPTERNPGVLRRAILLMEKSWLQGMGLRNWKCYVEQAIRELESEAGDGRIS